MAQHPAGGDLETSVVIVAVPRNDQDLPGSEAEKHCTLLNLGHFGADGDGAPGLEAAKDRVLETTAQVAASYGEIDCAVANIDELGDDGALVWHLDQAGVMPQVRTSLLDTAKGQLDVLLEEGTFTKYPEFLPHVTIGYNEPLSGDVIATLNGVTEIGFDRLAVWWGDERFEFPLGASNELHEEPAVTEMAVKMTERFARPKKINVSKFTTVLDQLGDRAGSARARKLGGAGDRVKLREMLDRKITTLEKAAEALETFVSAFVDEFNNPYAKQGKADSKDSGPRKDSGSRKDNRSDKEKSDAAEKAAETRKKQGGDQWRAPAGSPIGGQFIDMPHVAAAKTGSAQMSKAIMNALRRNDVPKAQKLAEKRLRQIDKALNSLSSIQFSGTVTTMTASGGTMQTTTAEKPAAEAKAQVLDKWEGPIGFEGQFTGDNRYIQPEGLDFTNVTFPQPFRWAAEDIGAHDGARVIGSIHGIERFSKPTVRNGETYPVGTIWGWGDFDMKSELGLEAQRHVEEKRTNGVSLDLDKISAEVADATSMAAAGIDLADAVEDMNITAIRKARSRSATLVALPAFEGARISAVAQWSHQAPPAAPIADALGSQAHDCTGKDCKICAEAKGKIKKLSIGEARVDVKAVGSFAGIPTGIRIDKGGNWGAVFPGSWKGGGGYKWVPMPDVAMGELEGLVKEAYQNDPNLEKDAATLEEAIGDLPALKDEVSGLVGESKIEEAQGKVRDVLDGFPFDDYVNSDNEDTSNKATKLEDALNAFAEVDPDEFITALEARDTEGFGDFDEPQDTPSAGGYDPLKDMDDDYLRENIRLFKEDRAKLLKQLDKRETPEGLRELKEINDQLKKQQDELNRRQSPAAGYIGDVSLFDDEKKLGRSADGDGDGKVDEVENETTEADLTQPSQSPGDGLFPGGLNDGDTVMIGDETYMLENNKGGWWIRSADAGVRPVELDEIDAKVTEGGRGGWTADHKDGGSRPHPGPIDPFGEDDEAEAEEEIPEGIVPFKDGYEVIDEDGTNEWFRTLDEAKAALEKKGDSSSEVNGVTIPPAGSDPSFDPNSGELWADNPAEVEEALKKQGYTFDEDKSEWSFSLRKRGAWKVRSTVLASGAAVEDVTSEDFEVLAADALTVANDLREEEGLIEEGTRAAGGHDLDKDMDRLIDSIDAVFARRKAGVAEMIAAASSSMAVIDINNDWHSPKTGKYIHKPWEFDLNLKTAIPKDRQIQLTSALQTTSEGKQSNVGGDLFYLRKQLRQFQADPSDKRLDMIWDQLADFRNSWSIGSNVLAGMNLLGDAEYEQVDETLNELEESLEFIEFSMRQGSDNLLPNGSLEVEKKSELGSINDGCFQTGAFADSSSCPTSLGGAQRDFRGTAINPGNSQEWKFDGKSLNNGAGDVVEMRQTANGDIYAYAKVDGQEYFAKDPQDVVDAVEASTNAVSYVDKHGLKVDDADKMDAGMLILGTLIPQGLPPALFQEALNVYFAQKGDGARLRALEEWLQQSGYLEVPEAAPRVYTEDDLLREYFDDDDYFATREERAGKLQSLVASGAMPTTTLAAPVKPPAAWFDNPNFKTFSPLTVTKEGRVFGHLALWGTCHAALGGPAGNCIMVPSSRTNYELFHLGAVETAEGHDVYTGPLTMNTGHADDSFSSRKALAHYENTGLAIADIRVGEDQFGIWISGALRPDATPAQIRALKASPISGDWRRNAPTDSLELRAALAVNMPGYAVPRPKFMVASGALQSLTAAGMVPPAKVSKEKVEAAVAGDSLALADIRYLKNLLARERTAEAAKLRHQVLLATGAKERIDAMASMIADQERTMQAEKLEALAAKAKTLGLVSPEDEDDEDQPPLFRTTQPYKSTLKSEEGALR